MNKLEVKQIIEYIIPKILNTNINEGVWLYYVKNNVIHIQVYDEERIFNSNFFKKCSYVHSYKKDKETSSYILTLKPISNDVFNTNTYTVNLSILSSQEELDFFLKNYNHTHTSDLNFLQYEFLNQTKEKEEFNYIDFNSYIPLINESEDKLSNLELEIKLRCPSKTIFFKVLYELFNRYSKNYSFEKSNVTYFKNSNLREIFYPDKLIKVMENKVTLKHQKLFENEVKVTLSEEKEEKIKEKKSLPLPQRDFQRNRLRHSFTSFYPSFPNIRIDLTDLVDTFEIEIDYTFSRSEKENLSKKDIFSSKYLSQLNYTFFDLFKIMTNSNLFYLPSEKKIFADELIKYKDHPSLKHPVDLTADTLVTNGKELEKSYVYSHKADGYTYIMTIRENILYLISPNGFSFEKVGRIENSPKNSLYFVGEKIPYENRLDDKSSSASLFVIFDCMCKGNYKERYEQCKEFINQTSFGDKNIKVILKEIFPLNLNTFYQDEIENENKFPFKTDGFIFTPLEGGNPIYKIKPFNQLSIDFELDFNNKDLLMGQKEVFTGDYKVDWDDIDRMIVEKYKWIYNLSFGIIAEFSPSRDNNSSSSSQITLSFTRFRNFDKLYPNGKITVQNVWNLVTDTNTIYDYLNISKGILRLRRFHNLIKSHLIEEIGKKENRNGNEFLNILDIGSGRGGDLKKFSKLNFNKLVLVEPDKDNLRELEMRLKNNFRLNKRNIQILNTGGEDKVPIVKAFNGETTNNDYIILSMLSLTFLFNPLLYPSFLDTINSLYKDVFYFFTFDKYKALEALKKFGSDEKSKITLFKKNKYNIVYNKKKENIHINIDNTIVNDQTEYLVDIQKLAEDTNSVELFINSSETFVNEKYKNAFLSEDEKIFNKFFIFGKIVYGRNNNKIPSRINIIEDNNVAVSGSFVDYMAQIKDFYKQDFREFEIKKASGASRGSKATDKKKDKNISSSDLQKSLDKVKKDFPFGNPFYKYLNYVNNKKLTSSSFSSSSSSFPLVTTKAFLKMNEILHTYDKEIFDSHSHSSIKLFCNAELPGGFLSAIVNYAHSKNIKVEWNASSLFEGETFLDDIYGMVKKYPERWLMNKKFNGDITNFNNLLYIKNYFIDSKVNLYTSDVGVGLNEDIVSQEDSNFFVNLGQILSALYVLEEGGTMIIKTYTFFEEYSISLIKFLYNLFDKLKIVKPGTSSKFNSEVYIIGFGYKENKELMNKELINDFENYVERSLKDQSKKEVFTFKSSSSLNIDQASSFYFSYQLQSLIELKYIFENYKKLMVNINDFDKFFNNKSIEYTNEWLMKYPIMKKEKKEREGEQSSSFPEPIIIENTINVNEREYTLSFRERASPSVKQFGTVNSTSFKVDLRKEKEILPSFFSNSFYNNKKIVLVHSFEISKRECNTLLFYFTDYLKDKYKDFYSIVYKMKKIVSKNLRDNELKNCLVNTFKSLSFKIIFEDEKYIYYERVIR